LRCDRRSGAFNRILGSLRVKAALVARGRQFADAVLRQPNRLLPFFQALFRPSMSKQLAAILANIW
jgi:hypothetical protein